MSLCVCVCVSVQERNREEERLQIEQTLGNAVSGVWWGALKLWNDFSKFSESCDSLECIVLVKPILFEIGFNQRICFPK